MSYFDKNGYKTHYIRAPINKERIYNANFILHVYNGGSVEILKNRHGITGNINFEDAINCFSTIIAELKLKDTQLDMFKEGLSQLIQEAIENVLKGDFSNERNVCRESLPNGSHV